MITASAVIILLLGVGLVGLLLFLKGLRVRPIVRDQDQPPNCGKCGYNLTGATSAQCPECGIALEPHVIVFGKYRHHRKALLGGLILMMIATAPPITLIMTSLYRGNWWLKLAPASWVLASSQDGNYRAFYEIQRRSKSTDTSSAELEAITQFALDIQSRQSAGTLQHQWPRMLEELKKADRLSPSQLDQYYRQLMSKALGIRPQVLAGETMPVELVYDHVGGPGRKSHFIIDQKLLVDGQALPQVMPDQLAYGQNQRRPLSGQGRRMSRWDITGLAPGKHRVEYQATEKIFAMHFPDLDKASCDPLHTSQISLSGEVEILPADSSPPVTLITDAKVLPELRQGVLVELRGQPRVQEQSTRLSLSVTLGNYVKPLPVDTAFKFVGRAGDQEFELGEICHYSDDDRPTRRHFSVEIPLVTDQVEIILRPNPQVAREHSVAIKEIWGQELIYGPFQVEKY